MDPLIERLLAAAPEICYVALYRAGRLVSAERPGLADASAVESDKYEELIVNPTLLTLVTQRGNIDCGGVRFVLIRYGSFFEYVRPIAGGHASVGIEPRAEPLKVAAAVDAALALEGLSDTT